MKQILFCIILLFAFTNKALGQAINFKSGDWTFSNSHGVTKKFRYSGTLELQSFSANYHNNDWVATSPEFNLSKFTAPEISFTGEGFIMASQDDVVLCSSEEETKITLALPKDVRQLKFAVKEGYKLKISDLIIREKDTRLIWGNLELIEVDALRWYDDDKDGNMKFVSSKRYYSISKNPSVYKITNEGPIASYTFENITLDYNDIIYPYNIYNNAETNYYAINVEYTDNFSNQSLLAINRKDDTIVKAVIDYKGIDKRIISALPCDYNSDGLTDFLLRNDSVAVQCKDGSFLMRRIETLTQEEYKKRKEGDNSWAPQRGGIVTQKKSDAFLSGKDMFIGTGDYSGVLGKQVTELDFDKDGRMDLINTTTGELLLNVGEEQYVKIPLGGAIYFRDLNNDYRPDYIVYEPKKKTVTAFVEQADGSTKQQLLISNLSMDSKIWCYDFDKDGDVDVLLPFSYLDSNGASFLVLMENDGTGKFKMKENYYDEEYTFRYCTDMDNDGYFDIIATTTDKLVCIKGKPGLQFDTTSQVLVEGVFQYSFNPSDDEKNNILVADINNDGVCEVITNDRILYLPIEKANTAPSKPDKPQYLFESSTGYLKVNWVAGKDKESSSADLTYALRIGSEPGKGDVFYAHATANGTRLNLLEGNMGYNLDKVLNTSGWNAGKYYIAIQAIDPMGKGSMWSEEAVFDKKQLSSDFRLSGERTLVDVITVSLTDTKDSKLQYHWNFDDANIVSVNADKSIYKIQFPTPGEKIITLQTTDKNQNMSQVTERKLFVFGNKLESMNLSLSPTVIASKIEAIVDLDNDGIAEFLTYNGVYERKENGTYEKIKKLYNTNLKFHTWYSEGLFVVDCNKDGNADVLHANEEKGYWLDFYLNNDASLEVQRNTQPINDWYFNNCNSSGDLNNDGNIDLWIDCTYSIDIQLNTGDYLNYNRIYEYGKALKIVDLDRDGFLDGVHTKIDMGGFVNLAFNNGDATFTTKKCPSPLISEGITAVADMNNDGYQDLILIQNEQTIIVAINNKNSDFYSTKILTLPFPINTDKGILEVFDFDNNGYLDLALATNSKKGITGSILYFYPNLEVQWHDYGVRGMYNAETCLSEYANIIYDVDRDGVPDILENSGNNLKNNSTLINTRPDAPQNLRATQQEKFLHLEWDAAKDAETPSVHMRYNISVKKKGAEGEGSFVISPVNGLSDNAPVIHNYTYPTATCYQIPLSSLPVGEYEAKVQAIDGWNTTSAYSSTYMFKIEASPSIKVPVSICAGISVAVEYTGNAGSSEPVWNWDGGELLAKEGNTYEVVWNTSGEKQISASLDGATSTTPVFVNPAINPNFAIPANALTNTPCPIVMPEGEYNIAWSVGVDGGELKDIISQSDLLYIKQGSNAKDVNLVFTSAGVYVLQLEVETACGKSICKHTVTVSKHADEFQINQIGVDATTGKNLVSWTLPAAMPSFVTAVNVYKEGSKYNDFSLIATIPLTQSSYIDVNSNPKDCSSRYQLTLQTEYGTESAPTQPHQSVHVIINKGMEANRWNLQWSKYEGRTVESYRILRGISPESLAVIAEVSGHAMSYSDATAPSEPLFYALEFSLVNNETRATNNSIRSNVASVADAATIVFAESVQVRSLESEASLTESQKVLHLFAEIYPLIASYRNVEWTITSGSDLATIDSYGVLTSKQTGNGKVIVRASAIDGSGIYADLEVEVSGFSVGVEENVIEEEAVIVYPSPVVDELHIKNIPTRDGEVQVYIFNTSGHLLHLEKTRNAELTISCGELDKGIYILKMASNQKSLVRRFVKK